MQIVTESTIQGLMHTVETRLSQVPETVKTLLEILTKVFTEFSLDDCTEEERKSIAGSIRFRVDSMSAMVDYLYKVAGMIESGSICK